jgi:UDP-N-acetyl-D-glucosamine dehydrogenase
LAAEKSGHNVVGFDTNSELVKNLSKGISHVEGISSTDLASATNYLPTDNVENIVDSEVVVIAVPTPLNSDRKPDLTYLVKACELIGQNLPKKALIINESTSFPGTLRDLISVNIEQLSSLNHLYAVSPERVDPGNQLWNQSNTPRLISGLNDEATEKAYDFYSTFCAHVIKVSTPEIAEAAKLFENSFRQVNIAMVNELAQISHGLGINVNEVLDAAATKPFGFMKFNPSLGVGGHCIPVDPTYLSFAAENIGVRAEFIDLANKINLDMPHYISRRISNDVGGLAGKKILVAGISYKANIADLRESPSLQLITEFKAQGATVSWHDPLVISYNGESTSDIDNFDIAVLAVAHDAIDKEKLVKSAPYIFDCTGTLKGVAGI